MKINKFLVFFFIIAVLVLFAGYYYFYLQNLHQAANGTKLASSGTIEGTDVLVGTKIPGRIKEVLVKEGDKVQAGQRLASLEDSELTAQMEQARSTVSLARANYQDALADRDRNQPLFDQGIISSQQFDKVATRLKTSGASLDQAKATAELAQTQLDNVQILAPINGTITQRLTEPGEIIGAGSPVVSIVNLDDIWVKVYVPEPQLGKVALGDPADISVDSYPKEIFKGKIVNISSEAEFTPKNIQTKQERVQLVFGVKVAIANTEGKLKPGMPADVVIHLQQPVTE